MKRQPSLRLAFAGTPDLAASVLQRLISDGTHAITRVYTQPDKKTGRGRKYQAGPVKQLAEQHNIPLEQPGRPDELDPENELKTVDALVVAAYGMLLPATVLNAPRLGCINVHTSLLPRWRGAAPIQRAIQAGDEKTGITIMQMDKGLDTGDILYQRSCPILADDSGKSLHDRLAILGGDALLEALRALAENRITPQKQGETGVTYAKKLTKEEADIDWTQSAAQIERTIRAFNPVPMAYTELNGISMRVWQARILPEQAAGASPGTVLGYSADGIDVATADYPVRISRLQLPGKKTISARDFANSHPQFLQSGS